MAEISKNGVYFDTKAGKVVDSKPEEGVQIIAPGDEVTEALKASVESWRESESVDAASEPEPAQESESDPVTTEVAAGSGSKAKAK